jgi:acetyl-CoA acetyltransferase
MAGRAEAARAYLAASGAGVDHLARTAVKNHRHGAHNPAAPRAAEVPLQAVLGSDPVAWPLTRMMVAPSTAGAAAVVLASRRASRAAPRVRASVLASDDEGRADDERAGQLAYWAAGVGPEDLDCAEVHDDTAASELAAYETLQLAAPGHGPELIESGFTALGGVLPVNTSGGLLSLGELDGVSAIAQVCELHAQLTGAAGARQVPGARIAIAHSRGPAHDGGGLAAVTVIEAP